VGIGNILVGSVENSRPPNFIPLAGSDTVQSLRRQLQLTTALAIARSMAAFMASGGWRLNFSLWFGVQSGGMFGNLQPQVQVLQTWTLTNALIQSTIPDFVEVDPGSANCTASPGMEREAFVADAEVAYTIHLCPPFWNLPVNPKDRNQPSMAGTILHESAHKAAGVEDFASGYDASLKLAQQHPDQAVENAANYEYQAEDLFSEGP
jgi:Lysine-specific metallo-endopeptidase